MGKTPKRKLKWRNLDIDTEYKSIEEPSVVKPHSEVHPFLKIISKNMDAIVKKDSTQKFDDSKLVFLYRSDKKVGVQNPKDLSQFAGKPIEYKPVQQAQVSNTIHYSAEPQQQPIYYQSYPAYTAPIHTPSTPSHSQDMFIPNLPHQHQVPYPMPMYYATHPNYQHIQIPAPQQIPYHQPPVHAADLPHPTHLPQVEYVP